MPDDIIKISVTGDILCKKKMLKDAEKGDRYDFRDTFSGLTPLIKDSDITIGNLETPVTESREGLVRANISFCAPREFAEAVYDAGIHYVSTANNHALDRGIEGLNETIRVLDDIGFKHTGTFSDPERPNLVFTKKGVRIGMLSYTYGTNAHHNRNYIDEADQWRINLFQKQELHNKFLRYIFVNRDDNYFLRTLDRIYCAFHPWYFGKAVGQRRQSDRYELKCLDEDIRRIKREEPDILIMSMHIGGQYNVKPCRYARKTAELLTKSGINLIIGNHEHRIHGCDLREIGDNKFVTYCLGNLVSTVGVTEPPYDREADYSVLCHIYIDTGSKKTVKITYNIMKIIEDEKGFIRVVPAYDLYRSLIDSDEKVKIRRSVEKASREFSGEENGQDPKEEYILYVSDGRK